MQGATGGVAKEGIVQVDCKGSGGLLEGWAVLRRGQGKGAACAGVGRGDGSRRCSQSRRMSGGRVRGETGTQVL